VTTLEGVKALACFLLLLVIHLGLLAVRLGLRLSPISRGRRLRWMVWLRHAYPRRYASRTTILRRVLSDIVFNRATFADLREDRPKLIVVACELRTKSAFYFARDGIGSWRLGRTDPGRIEIAHAVVASAAYPAFLPALDECLTFEKSGRVGRQRVVLTDGGVYDNLGLAPLWPDRDPGVSLHANKFDFIVACRAGYGLGLSPPPMFWRSRMEAAFESIFARAQNFAMSRLFDLKNSGGIKGFIVPYLGQDDNKLEFPPPDLVTAESTRAYPTDFSAMEPEWIDRLSKRGEQLTVALLREHLPQLLHGT